MTSVCSTLGQRRAAVRIGTFRVATPNRQRWQRNALRAVVATRLPAPLRTSDDFVGALKRNGYYKFTVTQTGLRDIRMTNLFDNADLSYLDF